MLSSDNNPLILHLNLAQEKVYTSYRLDIIDANGKKVLTDTKIRPDDVGGRFTIILPPGFFSPGAYRILLSGSDGQRLEKMKEYSFAIVNG